VIYNSSNWEDDQLELLELEDVLFLLGEGAEVNVQNKVR